MNLLLLSLVLIWALAAEAFVQPAAPPKNYTACGVTSERNFRTWTGSLNTSLPLIFPTTESELQNLVRRVSRIPQCKIRVAGTRYSSDGIVALKNDPNVVVISLADLVPNNEWNNKLDRNLARVRVGAGRSFLDLSAFLRPRGFLLVSRPYGRLFSVGGFYMNPSTHGATLTSDRVAKQITGIRALLSNGEIVDIMDERRLSQWRGSMGLLGIVIAVELQVMRDEGIVQLFREKSFGAAEWTQPNVMRYLIDSTNGSDAVHFFYNFWDNKILSLITKNKVDRSFNFEATQAYFDEAKALFPDLAREGVPILNIEDVLSQIPPGMGLLELSAAISTSSNEVIKQNWQAANMLARDGFVHDMPQGIINPHVTETWMRCPDDCVQDGMVFRALEGYRQIVQDALSIQVPNSPWYPTTPASFRIFTASNPQAMLLDALKPGRYLAMEFTDVKRLFPDGTNTRVYRRVERLLRTLSTETNSHIGKEYGWGQLDRLDQFMPFQNKGYTNGVFPPAIRRRFVAAMNQVDRRRLFRTGAALRLLGLTETAEFDPRSMDGEPCMATSHCKTGCCCQNFLLCYAAGIFETCVSCESPLL